MEVITWFQKGRVTAKDKAGRKQGQSSKAHFFLVDEVDRRSSLTHHIYIKQPSNLIFSSRQTLFRPDLLIASNCKFGLSTTGHFLRGHLMDIQPELQSLHRHMRRIRHIHVYNHAHACVQSGTYIRIKIIKMHVPRSYTFWSTFLFKLAFLKCL
jgi:hypothetical protein